MRTRSKIVEIKREYPKYSNAKEALEHFRFITILTKWTEDKKIPSDYIEHISNEIDRFEKIKVKGNEKKKMFNKQTISKLDNLLTDTVKVNMSKKDFSLAVKTEKIDDGVIIENLLIKKNEEDYYDIIDTTTNKELFYDVNQYKLAYLLTVATIEGKNRKSTEVKQLIDNNNQYSNLLESLDANHEKMELASTDKEKSTIETIISGLENQLNILDQLISAQYTHKNNSLKA